MSASPEVNVDFVFGGQGWAFRSNPITRGQEPRRDVKGQPQECRIKSQDHGHNPQTQRATEP